MHTEQLQAHNSSDQQYKQLPWTQDISLMLLYIFSQNSATWIPSYITKKKTVIKWKLFNRKTKLEIQYFNYQYIVKWLHSSFFFLGRAELAKLSQSRQETWLVVVLACECNS